MSENSNFVIARNAVSIVGHGEQTAVLAHGFGCNQQMWHHFIPHLRDRMRLVLFDYTGFGKADPGGFDPRKYSKLDGYAQDVIDIFDALDLSQATFIGHSVSSMIGLIAAIQRPDLMGRLVMVCPSPCFMNDPPDYMGGFEREDLVELIDLIDRNFIGWANYLAPVVLGPGNDPTLLEELVEGFRKTAPNRAKIFAQATFLADCRPLLPMAPCPCVVFQSTADNLASPAIGAFLEQQLPDCRLEEVNASGHCLHMTDPEVLSRRLLSIMNSPPHAA